MTTNNGTTRRNFLRFSAGAFAAAGASTLFDMKRMAKAAGGSNYKALVCVYLTGGNDGHNLLVPRDTAGYDVYAAGRQELAIAKNSLLPITPAVSESTEYGLHPSMSGCQTLFGEGRLGILRNVGALIEPVTKASYEAQSVALPPQLFSHYDQEIFWHTALTNSSNATGWLGRISDRITQVFGASTLPASISLAGANLLQVGKETDFYNMGLDGAPVHRAFDGSLGPQRRAAMEQLLNQDQATPFTATFASRQKEAIEIAELVNAELDVASPLATQFPDSELGKQLEMTARMIAVREGLGLDRQVFFCEKGGFDTHSELLDLQPELLADVDACLLAFQRAMEELGVENEVTLFTGSDFGRTMSSNGKGADHGWGSHHMVMGGAVNGGSLFGTMPNLEIDGPDDTGAGRIIPTTSVDQYGAELARWFGVPEPYMGEVFPGLANFPTGDLGMFA